MHDIRSISIHKSPSVIPAQAGIQIELRRSHEDWIARMTVMVS